MTYSDNLTSRSYSGRPGCMCGCNGNYNDSPLARKRAWNKLNKDSGTKLDIWNVDRDGVAGCIYLDSDTRTNVVYLTQAGVDAVNRMRLRKAMARRS